MQRYGEAIMANIRKRLACCLFRERSGFQRRMAFTFALSEFGAKAGDLDRGCNLAALCLLKPIVTKTYEDN